MSNKTLKSLAIILGIIAGLALLIVSTNIDNIEQRKEQQAYEQILHAPKDNLHSLQSYLDKYPNAPKGHRDYVQSKVNKLNSKHNAAPPQRTAPPPRMAPPPQRNQRPTTNPTRPANTPQRNNRRNSSSYGSNRLSTGSQPYAEWYGYNSSCDEWGCSQIKVTAPESADVIVLIKRNNSSGRTIRHAYIRSGQTYTFEIPDGRYQVFFYYGNDWDSSKDMSGGITGGFSRNEVFSKDDPQYLENEVLSYVLQLKRNGNFKSKGSNKREMF